jgi:nucleoside-diphosphate-sugar epimerase
VIRQLGTDEIQLGSLEAWRDYIDVRDVAEAVVAVATADGQLPPVLNVGTGKATLAREVVHKLVELSGTSTKIVEGAVHADHAGSPANSVAWQQADTTLIAERLGWSSKIPLDQSLADTWTSRPT